MASRTPGMDLGALADDDSDPGGMQGRGQELVTGRGLGLTGEEAVVSKVLWMDSEDVREVRLARLGWEGRAGFRARLGAGLAQTTVVCSRAGGRRKRVRRLWFRHGRRAGATQCVVYGMAGWLVSVVAVFPVIHEAGATTEGSLSRGSFPQGHNRPHG